MIFWRISQNSEAGRVNRKWRNRVLYPYNKDRPDFYYISGLRSTIAYIYTYICKRYTVCNTHTHTHTSLFFSQRKGNPFFPGEISHVLCLGLTISPPFLHLQQKEWISGPLIANDIIPFSSFNISGKNKKPKPEFQRL